MKLDYEGRAGPEPPRQWPGPIVVAVFIAALLVLVWLLWKLSVGGFC